MLSLLKIQKLARHRRGPVIPATQEAEAGESLDPERQRLQSAEIMPLHSSLGYRARLCLKKKFFFGLTIIQFKEAEDRIPIPSGL